MAHNVQIIGHLSSNPTKCTHIIFQTTNKHRGGNPSLHSPGTPASKIVRGSEGLVDLVRPPKPWFVFRCLHWFLAVFVGLHAAAMCPKTAMTAPTTGANRSPKQPNKAHDSLNLAPIRASKPPSSHARGLENRGWCGVLLHMSEYGFFCSPPC